MRLCEVDDCENKYKARGMCHKHYQRMRNYGRLHALKVEGQRKYRPQHTYLQSTYGKATEHDCAVCSEPADQWAFIREWCPDDQVILEQRTFPRGEVREVEYSLDEGHYLTLCFSHHREMEKGRLFHA